MNENYNTNNVDFKKLNSRIIKINAKCNTNHRGDYIFLNTNA